MRASTTRWALVTLSMLGLAGCQSGRPSWWPGRNKMPQYSTSSTTPPPAAPQYTMPSSQVSPYGSEASTGQHDPSQYAQQTGGVATNPADPYGANNYAATAGQDPYAAAAAGGAVTPQSGMYDVNGYQQQPAGGMNGYPSNANSSYVAGQVANPYAPGGAPTGAGAYNDYQGQQSYGGAPFQGNAGADPAANVNYAADNRYADHGAGGARYDGAGAGGGYNTTPEQAPYNPAGGAGWGQGQAPAGNPPADPGYRPGDTGYNPPGVQPYQSPGGQSTGGQYAGGQYASDPNGGADPHYRPGGTGDYSTGAGAATNNGMAGAAGNGGGSNGAAGGAWNGNAGGTSPAAYDNGYGASAATIPASRYPDAASTSRYPTAGGDRYGRSTTPNASAINPADVNLPPR
ncbi:MAG TPA: hypothetical protein VN699_17645 [Pirellulales bacterium]|nr:hypothetical protein [Pirellulales bacterium]